MAKSNICRVQTSLFNKYRPSNVLQLKLMVDILWWTYWTLPLDHIGYTITKAAVYRIRCKEEGKDRAILCDFIKLI